MYMTRKFGATIDYTMKVDPDTYMLMENYLNYPNEQYNPIDMYLKRMAIIVMHSLLDYRQCYHIHIPLQSYYWANRPYKNMKIDPTMECSADVSWTGTIFNPSEHVFDSSNEPYSFTPHVPWSGCCS